ncbi:MAG: TonB-dependent receptor, partial [Acidobacteria bacterium]
MARRAFAAAVLAWLWIAATSHAVARPQASGNDAVFTVAGQVVDLTGAPVPGARVRVSSGGWVVADAVTGQDGEFTLQLPPGVLDVTATAHDMAAASARVRVPRPSDARDPLQLVLGAAVFSAAVTVAAPVVHPNGTEGSTSLVTSEAIGLVPARALDETLGATPGFSLFRRSPSRTANPTAQGVSLRGLGASGASRALVMADGFPANDPFGGWVYWSRLPVVSIERVEVARGGRSERHGADALGGVVGIVTSQASRPFAGRFLVEAGSRRTGKLSGFVGMQRGPWSWVASGEAGRSGRAPVVAAEQRGPVDTPAGSDHAAGLFGVGWAPAPAFTATVRLNPFGEQRANGTPLQRNDTRSAQGSAVTGGAARGGQWEVRAWGQWTRFRQTFSVVSRDRASEALAARQRVESTAVGGRAAWDRVFGPAALGAGVEMRQVEADNLEGPAGGSPGEARTVGGRQRGAAVFGRVSMPFGPGVRVDAGVRWEAWRNTPSHLPGGSRDESRFSPRLTVTWTPAQGVVTHASGYGAFRAPTLNEL